MNRHVRIRKICTAEKGDFHMCNISIDVSGVLRIAIKANHIMNKRKQY